MTPPEIIVEQRGGILRITMNRPESLNALSEDIVSGDARCMQDPRSEIMEDYVGLIWRKIFPAVGPQGFPDRVAQN